MKDDESTKNPAPDPDDEELDDEDDEDDESPSEPATKATSSTRPVSKAAGTSREVSASSSSPGFMPVVIGIVALAIGGAGGWFGHQARAKAALRSEVTPAAAASGSASGPCATWEQKLCASGGPQAAECQQAKIATALLTPSVCEVAIEALPATLAKIKASRAPCDTLSTKLCKDLPPGSPACQMVKQQTARFPGDRCGEMLKNYDQVLSEVKQIDQQGVPPMPGGPHGGPPGGNPHGAPPGMPPGVPGSPHP